MCGVAMGLVAPAAFLTNSGIASWAGGGSFQQGWAEGQSDPLGAFDEIMTVSGGIPGAN